MTSLGKLTLYKTGRAIFRFIIAHPDNIRLATQGPVVRRLLPPKIDKALDIGCGGGRYTEWLVERTGRVSGIDINMKNLSGLRRKGINASVVCASADYGLPFRDSIFDFVLCTEVLEHLQNDGSAVKEIRRVLQENGELLISVPMAPPVYSDSAHKRHGYNLNKLESLLEKNGFEITDVDYCMLAISRLMLKFVSVFVRLMKCPPPILPLVYLERIVFFASNKCKCKPFNLVVRARKLCE